MKKSPAMRSLLMHPGRGRASRPVLCGGEGQPGFPTKPRRPLSSSWIVGGCATRPDRNSGRFIGSQTRECQSTLMTEGGGVRSGRGWVRACGRPLGLIAGIAHSGGVGDDLCASRHGLLSMVTAWGHTSPTPRFTLGRPGPGVPTRPAPGLLRVPCRTWRLRTGCRSGTPMWRGHERAVATVTANPTKRLTPAERKVLGK